MTHSTPFQVTVKVDPAISNLGTIFETAGSSAIAYGQRAGPVVNAYGHGGLVVGAVVNVTTVAVNTYKNGGDVANFVVEVTPSTVGTVLSYYAAETVASWALAALARVGVAVVAVAAGVTSPGWVPVLVAGVIIGYVATKGVEALIEVARDNDFIHKRFPAGTSITLASGETVSIEDIAIADQIAAIQNPSQNTNQEIAIDAPLSAGTVSRLYTNLTGDFVELNFIDPATGKQTTLTSTLGHVFLDENGNWRQIGNMIANANNIVSFAGANVANNTIAPKLTATILFQDSGANDNYPVHVTTGTNLKTTDRLLRRSGAKCIGGGYVV